MKFSWDENKAETNKRKHGITFEVATTVFSDPYRKEMFDEKHSTLDEQRYITIGRAGQTIVILFVVYMLRDETYRLISARVANKKEERSYYEDNDY